MAFLQLLISGISLGCIYALIALGFVLIYKASGVFNFAQGAMVLFAALAMARFAVWLPQWLGVESRLVGNLLGFVAAAAVMIARNNFGCGSSREAAVYVLADAGFRCVLAPSFGDIFTSNAIQNGLLPARVAACDIEALLNDPSVLAGAPITIDLTEQNVSFGNKTFAFDLRADFRQRLLNGWDAIDMTRSYAKDIEAFLVRDRAARPWRDPVR